MKFIRGKAGEIINLERVEIIDVVDVNGKLEVQAKLSDFSVVLADFEHTSHAQDFMDKIWASMNPFVNEFEAQLLKLKNESQESLAV
jgi:hypothetical protein